MDYVAFFEQVKGKKIKLLNKIGWSWIILEDMFEAGPEFVGSICLTDGFLEQGSSICICPECFDGQWSFIEDDLVTLDKRISSSLKSMYPQVSIPFSKANIVKLLTGKKTITVRSAGGNKPIILHSGCRGLFTIGDKTFLVENLGFKHVNELGGPARARQLEGLGSDEIPKYQQTQAWLDGERTLLVFQFCLWGSPSSQSEKESVW